MKNWNKPTLQILVNTAILSGAGTYYKYEKIVLAAATCGIATTLTATAPGTQLISICTNGQDCITGSLMTRYLATDGNSFTARLDNGLCS